MSEYYHPRYSGRRSRRHFRSPLLIVLLVLILLVSGAGWVAYMGLYRQNVYTGESGSVMITIPTGSNFDSVKKQLYTHGVIINRKSFEIVSSLKKYDLAIKPGRYKLTGDMGNVDLVNLLRSGQQEPVMVIFNNIRTPEQLAGRISRQIEADSVSIIRLLNDSAFLDSLGVTRNSLFTVIIPDSYEFYWNTSAREFINRMKSESEKFWNSSRQEKMQAQNLNRHEVITLAILS